MSTALWLARHELAGRRGSFLLGAGVVAAVVGLVVATDALGRGVEASVATKMDGISAPLEVVPEGVSATQLARGEIGTASLPPAALPVLRSALRGSARRLEPALVLRGDIAGHPAILAGLAGDAPPVSTLGKEEIAVGATLAQRAGLRAGDIAAVLGKAVRVGALLPSAGTIDDESVFLALDQLQLLSGADGRINRIRVFLHPGVNSAGAKEFLSGAGLKANVIRRDRGDAVDSDVPRSLSVWRAAAFAAAALACAGWLAFVTRLNLDERRREMATLAAIGAEPGFVVGAVVLRAAATAAAGGLAGAILGIAAGRVLQQESRPAMVVVAAAVLLITAVSAAVAVPVAALAARADPVRALEER